MTDRYAVNQRVRSLMDALGFKKNVDGFYKRYFGEGRSERLRTVFKDETAIKTDFLVEIAAKVEEVDKKKVNGHWLLTGEGEMFWQEKPQQTLSESESVVKEREELFKDLAFFRELVRSQQEVSKSQQETISVLARSKVAKDP